MTTAIVVLNWNGWKQTALCLESLLRLRGDDIRIIVCDNASRDGSVERLREWAAGSWSAWESAHHPLRPLVCPGIPKPLALTELDATAPLPDPTPDQRLVIIRTGANLGYAGGNNVGIAWALRDPACDAVWVLNNDTVIEPEALLALRRAAQG